MQEFLTLSDLPLHIIIGNLGAALYVISFGLLSYKIISGNSCLYYSMNIAAASMVLFSLSVDFNLASALIQIFWILIGLSGLVLHLNRSPDELPTAKAAA